MNRRSLHFQILYLDIVLLTEAKLRLKVNYLGGQRLLNGKADYVL